MGASSLRPSLLLRLALLLFLAEHGVCRSYSRGDFPADFVFGAGTSAYQYEGAVDEDGRKPSIWDTFTHEGRGPHKSNGDVASDGYHKYKEDVKLMTDIGLEAYKFSISWSRLLPDGRGVINSKGLNYYNNVINEIFKQGIKLHVTLYHGDLPQVLQDEYGGWLNKRIVDDFKEYANVCFREFGDRVSQWTTFAEPNIMAIAGYDNGIFAPGRCSYPFGTYGCTAGNSTTEPYIVAHNVLLTHARVVELYRNTYQDNQGGQIGINIYSMWYYPLTSSLLDLEAAERALDFMIDWCLHPLIFGDYPEIMKKNVGPRLPSFTQEQLEIVKGSFDFISLNHYTSSFVSDNSNGSQLSQRDYFADMFVKMGGSSNGTETDQGLPFKMLTDPLGLLRMLEHIKENYGNPPVYIEENGYGLGGADTLADTDRINYLSVYIGSVLDAMRNGAKVKGYFVWSLMDLFELLSGYNSCFGLYRVNFDDEERTRVPKLSAYWYSNFLKKNIEVIDFEGFVAGEKFSATQ
ncbi:Beta-glucosidase 22 [Platanthera zijinensis]|uniref:Beta-glucosidase 22 n=1 Tax=Platanthera zijinensis TaxID=2320716 RepID=A0AAP0G9W7_9ASPA